MTPSRMNIKRKEIEEIEEVNEIKECKHDHPHPPVFLYRCQTKGVADDPRLSLSKERSWK